MRFVLLLIAAVVAIVAGVAALQLTKPAPNAANPSATASAPIDGANVTTVDVLVAKTAIPVGATIKEDMIDKQPWPQHLVLEGFIVSGSKNADLIGKIARASIQAREPITASKVASPGDPSFLAAALPAGMRAITIATDTISGVAGYVFPGDRIDLVLTHNIPQEIRGSSQGSSKPAVSEILVPNVRVLAVNVRDASGKDTANSPPSSVTVELSEENVQRVRLAEKLGTLSLSLRAVADTNNDNIAPTGLGQLSGAQAERGPSAPAAPNTIRIIRGSKEEESAPRAAAAAPMMLLSPALPAEGR